MAFSAAYNTSITKILPKICRCAKWIEVIDPNVRTHNTIEYIIRNCRLCSDHFPEEAYRTEKRKRLSETAVPMKTQNSSSSVAKNESPEILTYTNEVVPQLCSPHPSETSQHESTLQQCRCCMTTELNTFSYLFEANILNAFVECTTLKAHAGDGLPNTICENCLKACQYWKQFKDLCIRNDKELRSIYLKDQKDDDSGRNFKEEPADSESNAERNEGECLLCSTCDAKLYGDEYMHHVCKDITEASSTKRPSKYIDLSDTEGDKYGGENNSQDSDDENDIIPDIGPYKCSKCPLIKNRLDRFEFHMQFHELVDVSRLRNSHTTQTNWFVRRK